MHPSKTITAVALIICLATLGSGQSPPSANPTVHLRVPEGTPLRLYITRRLWFRDGAVVTGKVIEPLWAFDRIVIPAGSVVQGHISSLDSVAKMVRAAALINGDFTPLKQAKLVFTSITFPDGQVMIIDTKPALGLSTIYDPNAKVRKGTSKPTNPNSVRSRVGSQVSTQVGSQIAARTHSILDMVRARNKREWVEDFLLNKLPYHPQWYRSQTRFDAELRQPLDFGTTVVSEENLAELGLLSGTETMAQFRLLSPVTSGDAKPGDAVEAVLSQPMYSSNKLLVFPEGTRFSGKVTLAQRARYFHRGGKVRFNFDHVDIAQLDLLRPANELTAAQGKQDAVQGQLDAVETNPNAVKVDGEGTAKATESKTRLLRPVLAGLIASRAADQDADRGRGVSGTTTGAGNSGGRALGGFSGLGLVGTAMSFGPSGIGIAFGYYGLARSVYTNVISRGSEITFERNTAMQIRLGAARGADQSKTAAR